MKEFCRDLAVSHDLWFFILHQLFLPRWLDNRQPREPREPGSVRLIFIAGSPPATELANAGDSATLELLALPRVDLNAISAFIEAGGSGTVTRKLPYEMIVVAARRMDRDQAQPGMSKRRRGRP